MHSVEWKSADPWAGKKGVIVGTANTGKLVQLSILITLTDQSQHTTWPKTCTKLVSKA